MSDVTITVGTNSVTISQEAIDDLKKFHGIDVISEITQALEQEVEYQTIMEVDYQTTLKEKNAS